MEGAASIVGKRQRPAFERFGSPKQQVHRGIVEPAEDWERGKPSHPELLRWLGRELVRDNYDVKRLARLILVMALALYWAVSTGMWDAEHNPTPAEKKTRGTVRARRGAA